MMRLVSLALMIVLPVLAATGQHLADRGLSERHHRHHDTYVAASVLTRTLIVVMVFMAVLGLALTWLCSLGVFEASTVVLGSFFSSFVVTMFLLWLLMRRYSVVTYDDRMVVTPILGRQRTIAYRDITSMEWHRALLGGRQDVRVFSKGQRRPSTIRGILDVQQILMRINRFDVLSASPSADERERG